MSRKKTISILGPLGLFLLFHFVILSAKILGKDDAIKFFIWYLLLFFAGYSSIPFTRSLFSQFQDHGWIFSKLIGILIPGYIMWVMGTVFHVPFNSKFCYIFFLLVPIAGLVFKRVWTKRNPAPLIDENNLRIIIFEEILFYFVFLIWVYLIGFNPATYGTEKFMDFGIVQSMVISETLPPEDIWYSGKILNYYYGGHYFTAFLAKISFMDAGYAYNLMRAFIPAFMFAGVFSVVRQAIEDKCGKKCSAMIGAFLSSCFAVFAGNGHYIMYQLIMPTLSKVFVTETHRYWFPDSTRYIGYNPDNPVDRTIHEFPCYSFVLGDLHAHMINIVFVITLLSLLYVYLRKKHAKERTVLQVIAVSFLVGLFQWINYWDYIIYTAAVLIAAVIGNVIYGEIKDSWKSLLTEAGIIIGTGICAALPFTCHFQSIYKGVGIVKNHSTLFQLLVLWGIPFTVSLLFIGRFMHEILERVRAKKGNKFLILQKRHPADFYIFILSCCAMGLVLIPELVYVRDIYEETSPRANTMFKLTYQAFIMFSICSGYLLIRMREAAKSIRILSGILLFTNFLSIGYFFNSAAVWFPEYDSPARRQGISAIGFLDQNDFSVEKEALLWCKDNLEYGVILEAPGASYTSYERVSVLTGLPTVVGWYTHEWLWRDDTDLLNQRIKDVEIIYTSEDRKEVTEMLQKYKVSYIFCGVREKEKYPFLNEKLLKDIGNVLYDDGNVFVVQIKD